MKQIIVICHELPEINHTLSKMYQQGIIIIFYLQYYIAHIHNIYSSGHIAIAFQEELKELNEYRLVVRWKYEDIGYYWG
jgi:hypothetical protein